MRTFLIAAAAAASALVASAPAAAQYYPQPYVHPQGQYGQYGGRHLHERLERIRHEIERLDRRDVLSEREARYLRQEARDLSYRMQRARYNGLSRGERHNLDRRLDRLEHRVFREARDGNKRPGGGWGDNDRRWGDHDNRWGDNDRRWDDRRWDDR